MFRSWPRKCFTWLIPFVLLLAGLALALIPPRSGGESLGNHLQSEVLIQAEELRDLIAQHDPHLRIIDFRHKAKYYLGHIPGALQLWRPEIENRRPSLPGLSAPSLPPAPPGKIEKLLGRLGVGSYDNIIIYSDQCDQAYLWWILARYGFPLQQMRILDGGFEAWKAQSYPTQLTAPHFRPTTFRFPAPPPKNFLVANLEEVKAAEGAPDKVIIDVRPPRLFLGEGTKEGVARPGRIPGAVGIFWEENRVAGGRAKAAGRAPPNSGKYIAPRG